MSSNLSQGRITGLYLLRTLVLDGLVQVGGQELLVVVRIRLDLENVPVTTFEAVEFAPQKVLQTNWEFVEHGREEDALHVGDEVDLLDGLVKSRFFVQLLKRKKESKFY